jgi:hypothetical protein
MRRLAFISAASLALAVPAAALAVQAAAGDGSLVVSNGAAPWKGGATTIDVPVVAMRITGSVIGKVTDYGKIVIDAGNDPDAVVQVVGAGRPGDSTKSDTAQVWTGTDFTFRAVGGTFTVLVYGSHVNLIAAGKGTARVAGMPDTPRGDGKYSLNDSDFHSLPGVPTAKLAIGTGG